MNIRDIENLLKQRYSKMSEEDKEVIRDMYYSDVAGPVLRRFMGGSVTNTFKLRKPNKMALGNRVPPPGYIGGYNENATPQETIANKSLLYERWAGAMLAYAEDLAMA